MAIWGNIFKRQRRTLEKVDYLQEGADLLSSGKFKEALTSFKLALRDAPRDAWILQQIAICHTRIGMTHEAERNYRLVLEADPDAPGAHYGLAFLLLREQKVEEAAQHLEAFLAKAPTIPEAAEHVNHAATTLEGLKIELARGGPDEGGRR